MKGGRKLRPMFVFLNYLLLLCALCVFVVN
jgi:hypothetical protein